MWDTLTRYSFHDEMLAMLSSRWLIFYLFIFFIFAFYPFGGGRLQGWRLDEWGYGRYMM